MELWWSLAVGADLGGKATAVGASANIVILGLAVKPATRSPLGFTKHGLIVGSPPVGWTSVSWQSRRRSARPTRCC